jgi:hypothetical protein
MDKNLNINLESDVKLVCVSDIHEHVDQFFNVLNKFPLSANQRLVVIGDVFDKGKSIEDAFKLAEVIKSYEDQGLAYYIRGNHELKNIKKLKKVGELSPLMKWVSSRPISLSFVYPNGTRYTMVHAGVDPKMHWHDLSHDYNVCYIRVLSNKTFTHVSMQRVTSDNGETYWEPVEKDVSNWHKLYDGRFGYIVSGHDYNENGPIFYDYSCNIDTGVFVTGKLTAVVFGDNGREEVYQAVGAALSPHKGGKSVYE